MNQRIFGICLIAAVFVGCDDLLRTQPETEVSTSTFYASQEDFEQAVAGAYAPLQDIYESAWIMSEMRSDNTHFIYDVANRGSKPEEDVATFLVETNNRVVSGRWEDNYLIISRVNQVLTSIDDITFDESVKQNLKGQALFLRALAYFDLVRNFAGVPLFLEPPASYEETFKPRTPSSEIYNQIIADASAAATLLPPSSDQGTGRATSGAAYTLLGDVYLTLGRWSDAEAALKSVEGYSLLPDYLDVFRPSNEGNSEIILEVEYLEGTAQGLGSSFPYDFLPVLSDPSVITGVSPASQNNNGAFNTPTPDIIGAYEDTLKDERYAASIAYYSGPSPLVGVTYENTPYIRKYQHPHAQYGETDQNWPVYRYAEVLLMLAEAVNEQGGREGEALTYLNQVRGRAGLDAVTSGSQAELRDVILRERRIELAFENKRWYDLVRTGRAVEVMNAHGANVKTDPQAYYYPEGSFAVENSYTITEDDHLFPIPVTEININPDLQQNPGY